MLQALINPYMYILFTVIIFRYWMIEMFVSEIFVFEIFFSIPEAEPNSVASFNL